MKNEQQREKNVLVIKNKITGAVMINVYYNKSTSEIDLSNHDLRNANCRGVNFQDANCQGTDFRGTELRDANCQGADFRGAGLQITQLKYTNFTNISTHEPHLLIKILGYRYTAFIFDEYMEIGCRKYSHAEWLIFYRSKKLETGEVFSNYFSQDQIAIIHTIIKTLAKKTNQKKGE